MILNQLIPPVGLILRLWREKMCRRSVAPPPLQVVYRLITLRRNSSTSGPTSWASLMTKSARLTQFAAKVRQVLDEVATLELLYAFVLPDRCKLQRCVGGPLVKPDVRLYRAQKSEVYRFMKKTCKFSLKTVVERVLNGTASYEDLSRREGFTTNDFVKAWRPILEQSDEDCTIPALDVREVRWELLNPIQISEVSSSLKKTKNSAPGPNGYRLRDLLARPIEQITILLNLILLCRPG